ncbi:MAG TPA: phosphate signaling complex protein PhoU [Candidatus Dormibacteraeota bacterium]|nr:phosphate signaling complex protein PhoU [Candidatus Dormibacteraeota bacterium]
MTDDVLQELGGLVEGALAYALIALDHRDLVLADNVVRGDVEINRVRYEIEEKITARLSGSEAGDARWMVAALYVISELERMGDHAEGIAKVTLMLGPNPALPVPAVIGEMGALTLSMVHRTLAALDKRDVKAARALCREDDEIDSLYDRAYQELISTMVSDHSHITEATYMIWITHNLERIADRATNICERAVYLATGRVEELNVSKY